MKSNQPISYFSILREDYSQLFNNDDNGFCIYNTDLHENSILHYHEFYEIEILTEGKLIQNFNGVSEPISAGQVSFLTPSDFHEFYDIKEAGKGYTIHFAESNITPQLMAFLQNFQGTTFCVSENLLKFLCCECEQLMDAYLNLHPMRTLLIRSILEKIIITLLKNITTENSRYPDDMQKVLNYINKNFNKDISRKDIADMMHLNENYLSTKFQNIFGIQIQKLINKKRIIYARNMLLSTNIPVSEISYNSGFKSISQFYRTFKKEFGISPHEYKKNALNSASLRQAKGEIF